MVGCTMALNAGGAWTSPVTSMEARRPMSWDDSFYAQRLAPSPAVPSGGGAPTMSWSQTSVPRAISLNAAAAGGRLKLEGDPEFDCPMRVLSQLLSAHCAAILQHGGDAVSPAYITGNLPPVAWALGPDPRLTAAVANNSYVLVQDTHADPRWQPMPDDAGAIELGIAKDVRFYLTSSIRDDSGERIGTLSIWGSKPNLIAGTPTEKMVKDMIDVIEVHCRKAYEKWRAESRLADKQLLATLDAGQEALAVVDTSSDQWVIKHLSRTAMQLLGNVVEGEGLLFSSIFSLEDDAVETQDVKSEVVGTVLGCEVHVARIVHDSDRRFLLFMRPAVDQPIGRAWWVAHGQGKDARPPNTLRVMEVDELVPHSSRGSLSDGASFGSRCVSGEQRENQELDHAISQAWSMRSTSTGEHISQAAFAPIEGLELGPPVGKGAYGRVYGGRYFGEPVAVKIIDSLQSVRWSDGEPLEALLPSRVEDPGIVRTITQRVVPMERDGGRLSVVWLIMEWCELGDLGVAIVEGWFRVGPRKIGGRLEGPTNVRLVAETALQVAKGLCALHKRGVVHGDLSAGNVLLAAAPDLPQGFRAKLGDFGLSRQLLEVRSRVSTNSYGCINYLAPEVITESGLSKMADIYALGVLIWEMVSNQRAWAGMLHAQVMYTIAILKKCLEMPANCDPVLAKIIKECMSHDPASRPTAAQLVDRLQSLLDTLEPVASPSTPMPPE